MVVIRLSRKGSKKRPFYHVVVADRRNPRDGSFIENVGTYDPKDTTLALNFEKIGEWISKGAQPSDTVRSLIKRAQKSAAAA